MSVTAISGASSDVRYSSRDTTRRAPALNLAGESHSTWPMLQRAILLCEPLSAPHLALYVRRQDPQIDIRLATDLAQLMDALTDAPPATRLIAFCANTIVPARALRALGQTAYNIHPGPPTYPGVHPDAFAHADGVRTYGATAHELTPQIDGGAIIATAICDVPDGAGRTDIADLGFACALDLFQVLVRHCLQASSDFPRHPDAQWCGPYNTLNAYHARFGGDPARTPITTT